MLDKVCPVGRLHIKSSVDHSFSVPTPTKMMLIFIVHKIRIKMKMRHMWAVDISKLMMVDGRRKLNLSIIYYQTVYL